MNWKKEVLDLIAEMKVAADKPRCDQLNQLAADIISQDCRPMAMADNLEYWLKLTDKIIIDAGGPVSSGPDFTQEQIEYIRAKGW